MAFFFFRDFPSFAALAVEVRTNPIARNEAVTALLQRLGEGSRHDVYLWS